MVQWSSPRSSSSGGTSGLYTSASINGLGEDSSFILFGGGLCETMTCKSCTWQRHSYLEDTVLDC